MNFFFAIIDLAGMVALLLWGVRMVQTGIQRAFGAGLRKFLAHALKNRGSAVLAGIGVTAILQSSTATGLMTAGFAAGGLVELVPALGVMLGANIGTTLIVQVLSFDIDKVTPGLILVGFLLFQRAKAGRRDFGRVLIGLGLILLALHGFIGVLKPYQQAPGMQEVLNAIADRPLLDLLLVAGLTWAVHSSVAIVLLIMSFAARGVLPLYPALIMVLGANLGTAINPVLEGAAGDDLSGRRLSLGNLINRIIGVCLGLILVPHLAPLFLHMEPNASRAVADFHTAFNVVMAAIFFPLLAPYAALLKRWLPPRVNLADPARPIYLSPAAREAPPVALGYAAREALRMTDVLETMLKGFRDVLDRPDRKLIATVKSTDDILDKLNAAIKEYLVSLDPETLSSGDHDRLAEILTFSTNIEQAGDIVDRNLLNLASKRLKRGLSFSNEGKAELLTLADRVIDNNRQAAAVLMTEDVRAARMLANEKESFRQSEAAATSAHFARLRSGKIETTETSTLHLDLLRDLIQVNSHLVAAAAYPLLERKHELLPNRLKFDGRDSDQTPTPKTGTAE